LKKILKRWLENGYISSYIHSQLNSNNAILPRAYGLPKIHKPGYSLRITASSIDSPLHNFATFLQKILRKSFTTLTDKFKNSIEVTNKLCKIHIPENYWLVSLDVVSLFTNVPIDMILELLDNKWDLIEPHINISKQELLDAIRFILNSTYFKFNNKIYRQSHGAPMGSPLSPIVADFALQYLKSHILKKLFFTPSFYIRYIDNIAF